MIVSAADAHEFREAVTRAQNWLANGGDFSAPPAEQLIAEACIRMVGYRDAMPPGMHRHIKDMAVRLNVPIPEDNQYRAGAACLRLILAKLSEKYPPRNLTRHRPPPYYAPIRPKE
jgi:hypothetical protein